MRLAYPIPEAAELIGVSESMLWKLLERGALVRVKIGRRSVVRVAELERFLDAHAEEAIPDRIDERTAVVASHSSVTIDPKDGER